MKLALFVAYLSIFLLPLVNAFESREHVRFSPEQYLSGELFCRAWITACRQYKPRNLSLVYSSTSCLPGDFGGKHRNTEAVVDCVFGKKSVADRIMKNLGVKRI